jgi:hypothetical protein
MKAVRKLFPTPPLPLPIVHNLLAHRLISSLEQAVPLIDSQNGKLYRITT